MRIVRWLFALCLLLATAACLGGCASSARSLPQEGGLIAASALEQCSFEAVFEPGNPFQQLMDIILD
ncbi:hypothetical protein AB4059_02740 [Lysobacter sp. 2RAF19]